MEQKPAIEASDLVLFAHIVEQGSFSRAASRLGMPKSTLSRRVSGLEQALGERLLLRTTRKLALTEFGHAVLAHARQIDDELGAAAALAAYRQRRPSGRLRVSMPSDFANVVLVDLLAAFAALHPEVTLDIDLSPRRVDLIGENFDLALRMGDLPDDANLVARPIGVFPAGLYAAPDYIREHGNPRAPADLSSHAMLCLANRSGEAMGWRLGRTGGEHYIEPHPRFIANSPELLIRLARAGSGIAAAPDQYANAFCARGELMRILPDWCLPSVSGWAVFPGRRLMPAKTRAFIEMLECALNGRATPAPGA
ncbi:MAG TPA: LysR family transcriptional regulator [Rhodocyclaceae bacterium]|nr:LysR family transcriptional regulator [Rhodocyclaceae bacterium]